MLKLKDVKVDGMFCGAEKDAGKRGAGTITLIVINYY